MPKIRILVGDCRTLMAAMPPGSVSCIVTSPPYHRRRNYMPLGSPLAALEVGRGVCADGYVSEIVGAFAAARRLLEPGGVAWLNIGDQYAAGPTLLAGETLKKKDLLMLPSHVAVALRRDGWYLRSQVIWAKSNPQPESRAGRPICAHESIFMLSAGPSHHYDAAAVREAATMKPQRRRAARPDYGDTSVSQGARTGTGSRYTREDAPGQDTPDGKRHMRNVWHFPTQPFRGAHFAPFPERLADPCIRSGCRDGGTVLDPFGGSGTTCVVAHRLGRDSVMCELNPEYAALAVTRCLASGIPSADISLQA